MYKTEFFGDIVISPPLNKAEIQYLKDFSNSRRMERKLGIYYAMPKNNHGQWFGEHPTDVINGNKPPKGQPNLWCQWIPNDNGSKLIRNLPLNFYEPQNESVEWVVYLIQHFLKELPYVKLFYPILFNYVQPHKLNGIVYAEGEKPDDIWRLMVEENKVFIQKGEMEKLYKEKKNKIDWKQVLWKNREEIFYTPTNEEEVLLNIQAEKNNFNEIFKKGSIRNKTNVLLL